jgi:hypothetical protein
MEAYGWRERELNDRIVYDARGARIGWLYEPDDVLWLLPNESLAEVNRALRGQGRTITISKRTLGRRLREAGLLFEHSEDTFTTVKKVSGTTMRVIVIARAMIWPAPN